MPQLTVTQFIQKELRQLKKGDFVVFRARDSLGQSFTGWFGVGKDWEQGEQLGIYKTYV